ncbi:Panacea domain-containing protein [Arthrobacter caoxuetaonis]|uniref:DUF4065 domain-containing protein n=1 Tax=Arthrobacter caoxuetaonis TaxID=2886935 RepID=A0A9X1SE03_9MICC|nr:type II toxin-antitoxin system antitoxin SocA domain-containing protein [Arthrobacter caoxuetaonis]MCC3299337.1 DUF4065 domain-containing protein [Arthrobacter caoxuetaonis]USQ59170.1 DUF4065 domain-containing protein [Arthrobacter caoxuetaonis]
MPFETMHTANTILGRSFAGCLPVNLVQLQRILYFAAAEYAKHGRRFLAEEFEAWPTGPVLRSLHAKFQCLSGLPITMHAKNAAGSAYAIDETDTPILAAVLDAVWKHAGPLSAETLTDIAVQPGSAWSRTVPGAGRHIPATALAADTTYVQALNLKPLQ